jgi:2-polyprenyl-3-methyl-5-hydroxy-6-metoxy-1,4-benzoquinol methylase
VRSRPHLDIEACDISSVAIQHARSRAKSAGANVRFFQHDALQSTPGDFDIIYCSLFLHHLDEHEALRLMSTMRSAAREMVLISDLLRSRIGYAVTWCGVRMLTRSPVVHTDGPLSVRAAFTAGEALALACRAGMSQATILRHWPRRFLLKWNAP